MACWQTFFTKEYKTVGQHILKRCIAFGKRFYRKNIPTAAVRFCPMQNYLLMQNILKGG